MFESAELGHKVDKATFRKVEPALRARLLDAQFELAASKRFSMIILIGGVDGAGRGETINTLNAWMDPRQIETNGLGAPSDEEAERPPMWRFWRRLPPKGKIAIFFGSWYTLPILDRVYGRCTDADLDQSLEAIDRFERMLADEGVLLLKFWLHLSKKAQKQRLTRLEGDPKTRWRVSKTDWERFRLYDEFRRVSEHTLRLTSAAHAPWVVVEGTDARYRHLSVARTIAEVLEKRLKQPDERRQRPPPFPLLPEVDGRRIVDRLDLTLRLAKRGYEAALAKWQGRLNRLARSRKFAKRGLVAVFEGHDAAGKGGAIRRVTAALDARFYRIVQVAAPSDEEAARPYLWRFWRHVPGGGQVVMFDRSWYGRVLVERVEKLSTDADWMRAYSEINDFEAELDGNGVMVMKFWLAIDKDEQLKRFKEREALPFKQFKLTADDWRNRDKWDDYAGAVSDMVDRTSTEIAPWTLVEANDKQFARIKVLRTLVERLEAAL
jgi:polyphosphate:AMP phosphotransferase